MSDKPQEVAVRKQGIGCITTFFLICLAAVVVEDVRDNPQIWVPALVLVAAAGAGYLLWRDRQAAPAPPPARPPEPRAKRKHR